MGIKVSLEPHQILAVFWIVVFFATVPFMIAEMIIYYEFIQDSDMFSGFHLFEDVKPQKVHCLSTKQQNTDLALAQWIQVDQFSKLAIFAFVTLMAILGCMSMKQRQCSYFIMLFCGIIMFLYFLYQLVWLIIGIYIFRQVTTVLDGQYNCEERAIPFVWALSILGIVLTIICLVVSWLRPKQQEDYEQQDYKIRMRNQRESKKKVAVTNYQIPSERRLRSRKY